MSADGAQSFSPSLLLSVSRSLSALSPPAITLKPKRSNWYDGSVLCRSVGRSVGTAVVGLKCITSWRMTASA